MTARAKFSCESMEVFVGTYRNYRFRAINDDSTEENRKFTKYTPAGQLQISVDNPSISFVPGKEYYLDFTPVDEEEEEVNAG